MVAKNWFKRFIVVGVFVFAVVLLMRWFLENYFRLFQILMAWTAIIIGASFVIAYRKAYSLKQLTRKFMNILSKIFLGKEEKEVDFAFEEKEYAYNNELFLFAGFILLIIGASMLFGG